MNRAKWENCKSMTRLTVKLAEETGEVAKAHLEVLEASNEIQRRRAVAALRKEVGHVQFIAGLMEDMAIEAIDSTVSLH